MFLKIAKNFSGYFLQSRFFLIIVINILCIAHPVCAETIYVTSTDGGVGGDGTLNQALQTAQDGDIIDCSPIAGQTIYVSSALPAIGHNATTSTPTLTIVGSGVTIDGSGAHPAFSLGQGSATISDFIIQNAVSVGGSGGQGMTGGGGGTGGGGALYVHSGTTLTISAISLNDNQAVGGAGGAGNAIGGSGGGGGGFGGGRGGVALTAGAHAGSAGGGGGNNGGTAGGTDRGAGQPNTFTNFAGAGGGGGRPGIAVAGAGGSNASNPAVTGGAGGLCTANNGGGGGGGAGTSTLVGSHSSTGLPGGNAIDASPAGNGIGGSGGYGFGLDYSYGCGGGGGGGNGGGAGYGASGGGGGLHGPGGSGGSFGGGGGACSSSGVSAGGNGGFGAGGGAGRTGGVDAYGLGGAGGSATGLPAGGGGGSGLGGAIFIQQAGALIVQDGVSLSGNSTTAGLGGIAAGSGISGGNGSSLGQDIFIQSGGAITFQINNGLTILTPIQGAGLLSQVTSPTVTKSGVGRVNLNGINTYLGDTLIQSGILNLNGSVSGDLYLDASGTLSGNATIFGNIYNNGTILPGNSIGQIFTTDLYLYPTSVYHVEIDSAGNSDLVTASGFAQIDGSVVVTPNSLDFTAPLTYTIISAQSGITGNFSSVTSSVPALKSFLYNPLNVQMIYLPLQAVGLTGNAYTSAVAFSTVPNGINSDVDTVNNTLLTLNFDEMQAAFDQMSPAEFSGLTEVQLLDAILVRTTYSKHLQKFCCNTDSSCQQVWSIWSDAFAQWQDQKNAFGYKDTTVGGTIGCDYLIHDWVIGAAFSTTYDDFHWQYSPGVSRINNYYAGLYGLWSHNAYHIDLALLGSSNKYTTTRNISFSTIDRNAYSQHRGKDFLTHVGFAYWATEHPLQWAPYGNLDYVFQHEQGYTESGAGSLNLYVDPKKSKLFQAEVGISLSTILQMSYGSCTPMLTLGYINQTPCSNSNYSAHFVDSSTSFIGTGGKYKRNLFVPRLAFIYQTFCNTMNVSIFYDAQVGSNYWAQDIVFDLMFTF